MSRNKLAYAALSAATAILVSCGGGSSDDIAIEDLCGEDGGAFIGFVDKLFECTPEFAFFVGDAPTAAEISAACEAQFEPFVEDGTMELGQKKDLDACLAAIEGADCQTFEIDNLPECEDIISGFVAEGEDCESNDQCAGEAYCDESSNPDDCGVCAALLADGVTCEDNNQCLSGKCRSNGACGPFAAEGDTCDATADCVGQLVCDETCGVAGADAVGDACVEFTECGFPFSGLHCDQGTDECAEFLDIGDDCFDGAAALGVCNLVEYYSCDFGDTRKCVGATIVGLGDDCGFGQGLKCEEGLLCESGEGGTCVEPGIGSACDSTRENSSCGLFLECKDNNVCGYENEHTGMCPSQS